MPTLVVTDNVVAIQKESFIFIMLLIFHQSLKKTTALWAGKQDVDFIML